jgi:hypothetical protein
MELENICKFGAKHQNLRFGLGTDSMNSFGLWNGSYSVWLVVLMYYNLPPHMATKKGYIMLMLLIPVKY